MAAAAEVTIIFVDSSFFLNKDHPYIKAQIEAIKLYTTTKLKCNPNNRVGLFRMSTGDYGHLVPPTRDPEQILRYAEGLLYRCGGAVELIEAVEDILGYIDSFPMKKRLLVFVGSPIYLPARKVWGLGLLLKQTDIALDVVNFAVREEPFPPIAYEFEKYQYAREQLAELVTVVNDTGNNHFVDVDMDKSSVSDFLSKSILKKNLKYLRMKEERKAKTNVNLKQKLGKKENKAAAEYSKEFPSELDSFVNDTENTHLINCICKLIEADLSPEACRYREEEARLRKAKKNVNLKQENVNVEQDLEHLKITGKQLPSSELVTFVNDTHKSRKIDPICDKLCVSVPKKNIRYPMKELQKNVINVK